MPDTRAEIAARTTLSDEDWVGVQVPRFAEIRPRYAVYADFLGAVLRQGCGQLALWQSSKRERRPSPASRRRILRKRKSYAHPKAPAVRTPGPHDGPLRRAGHRPTSDQVHAVCRSSKRRSTSMRPTAKTSAGAAPHRVRLPVGALHRAGQSGKTPRPRASTIPVPPEVLGLKAEIQVRTLLEHAWADIGHEMTYKTEVKVPGRIHRQFAGGGGGAGRRGPSIRRLGERHGRVQVQLRRLSPTEGSGGRDRPAPHRALVRRRTTWTWPSRSPSLHFHRSARDGLGSPAALRGPAHQGVQRVRGVALTEMHWDDPRSKEYIEGRRSLEAACFPSAERRRDALRAGRELGARG